MELFGVRFVGVNAETGHKLLLTLAFLVGILLLRALIVLVARQAIGSNSISMWRREQVSVNQVACLSILLAKAERCPSG